MSYAPADTPNRVIAPGDRVRCLKHISFVDGHEHNANDILLVTSGTLGYYQQFVNGKEYEYFD